MTLSLTGWVVGIALVRALVVLFDDLVARAHRWGRMLWPQLASVVIRLGIVAVSAWQVSRLWGNASTLIESRLLAVAVAFDAAVWATHVLRFLLSIERHWISRMMFPGDPHVYRCCDEFERWLQAAPLDRGPRVLQTELRSMVRDYEVVSSQLRRGLADVPLGRGQSHCS